MRTKLLPIFATAVALLAPLASRASSPGESLKDDVFAMIATSQVLNTILVLDTSEQMNAFAYSGYIETCADAKSKINKSISLCKQALADCQETNANLMCGASIDCSDAQEKCGDSPPGSLLVARDELYAFCANVEDPNRYAEPGYLETDDGCDPVNEPNSKACRFIGPWNPARNNYSYDLCFYDWSTDTGADIPDTSDYSYSQYPNSPQTVDPISGEIGGPDRRDWRCLSDNAAEMVTRSGLWLNWKFATSLDAMKIILTDDHRFSYAPRRRSADSYVCKTRQWKATDGAGQCWEGFDPSDNAATTAVRDMVKANWQSVIIDDDNGNDLATCTDTTNPNYFKAASPEADSSTWLGSDTVGCTQCFDKSGGSVSCDSQVEYPHENDPTVPPTFSLEASNLRSSCRVFHCSNPLCRDETACLDDGTPCPLGYYSEWDQDPDHCCDPIGDPDSCDPATEFCCVETGSGSSSFMPGPGATVYAEAEADLDMAPLDTGKGQFYALVELSADSSWTITVLGDPDRLGSTRIEFFSGCQGTAALDKFWEEPHTAAERPYNTSRTEFLPYPIGLSGCDTTGYKIRVRIRLTHKNDADGLAKARFDFNIKVNYRIVEPSKLKVFQPIMPVFEGFSWEPVIGTTPPQIVKEYECKNIFYRMRSKVVGGSGGACDAPTCDVAGGCSSYPTCLAAGNCALPYPGCTAKETIAIGKDQWGSVTKSLCTWLCPDAPQYEDVWKCMSYFEMKDNDPAPNNNATPGDANIHCRPGVDSVYECCRTVNQYASWYQSLMTFDTNYYQDLLNPSSNGNFKCGMEHFQEGIANNERRRTSAVHIEITKGHINEVAGGGSYLMKSVLEAGDTFFEGAPTPYAGTNKWYSAYTLPNFSNSAIASSFISAFRTGENGARETACIYNIVQDLYGEDCDTCGMGCCMMDMGDINYCDYPSFWIRVAKTEGGNLILDHTSLVGTQLEQFRSQIRSLRGVGGAALGETLYDVWRYLGGFRPAYTDYTEKGIINYTSPVQGNPQCFVNHALVISGGQPNFDSNTTMDQQAAANFGDLSSPPSTPTPYPPYVWETKIWTDSEGHTQAEPLSTTASGSDPAFKDHPYYVENWYKTSLPEVAAFAHNEDAFHSNAACRASDPTTYRFGLYTDPCLKATDTSGNTVLDRIDTVGIGGWALAPLYAAFNGNSGYLDADATMRTAATNGGGQYYGLTAEASPNPADGTFVNLAQLFNSFAQTYEGTRAVGKPHWSSSPINPLGPYQSAMNNVIFMSSIVPVTQKASRFWFGNLKKYYLWGEPGKECVLTEDLAPGGGGDTCVIKKFKNDDLLDDCLNTTNNAVSGDNTYSVTEFNKVLSGGAAANLALQLQTCGGSPCYRNNTGRTIYYDKGGTLRNLRTDGDAQPLLLRSDFKVSAEADVIAILDYVHGYDSQDHDDDKNYTERRTDLDPLVMVDPFPTTPSNPPDTVTIPYSILGAAFHSKPIGVYYGAYTGTDKVTGLRIFMAANDGLLHSFDGGERDENGVCCLQHDEDGTCTNVWSGGCKEQWAYMPSVIMPELRFIRQGIDTVMFNSTLDGPLSLFHIDNGSCTESGATIEPNDGAINCGETAYLILGYRRGIPLEDSETGTTQSSYYTIIDISTKDSPAFVQHIQLSGQSWSKPTVFKIGGTFYLAFGGGYDPCFDADVPSCTTPTKGAKVHIWRYDSSSGKFVEEFTACPTGDTDTACDAFNDWLVASIAAEAVAVNTRGPMIAKDGTGDTEMIYFLDVTGTLFRVTKETSGWAFARLMMMRDNPTPFNFTNGIRSYYSFLTSPPYEQYNFVQFDANSDGDISTQEDVRIVPVPIVTGHIVNPKETGVQYEIVVFYDRRPNYAAGFTSIPSAPPLQPAKYTTSSSDFLDLTYAITNDAIVHSYTHGGNGYNHLYLGYYISFRPNSFTTTGWTASGDVQQSFTVAGEKGFASPIAYANWDYEFAALFATTYAPDNSVGSCSNAGVSFVYCRSLPTGDEITDIRYQQCSECDVITLGEGMAAAPSVMKGSRHGWDEVVGVSFGSNVGVFSEELAPPPKTIRILKWYEIY